MTDATGNKPHPSAGAAGATPASRGVAVEGANSAVPPPPPADSAQTVRIPRRDLPAPPAEADVDTQAHARSVTCEKHGLRYNPTTHAGCVRCRGVAAAADPRVKSPTEGPPLVFWILTLSAVVAVAVLVFSGGSEQTPSTSAPGPAGDTSVPAASAGGAPQSAGLAPGGSDAAANEWPTHEAVGEIAIDDRPDPVRFMVGDKVAPELRSVRFRGYNGHLNVTFEFARGVDEYAADFAAGLALAAAFVDTDLDEHTGEKGFAGRHGFERAIVGYVGVRYDPEADSYFWAGGAEDTPIHDWKCSHDVGTVSQHFLDLSYDPGDDEVLTNTTCTATRLSARVPYEALGVTAGQTVRIATEESMGSGKLPDYFLDDALLTLQ